MGPPSTEPLFSEQIAEKVACIPTDSLGVVGDPDAERIVQLSEADCRIPVDRKVHVVTRLVIMRAQEPLDQLGHVLVLVEGSSASNQEDGRHPLAHKTVLIGTGKERLLGTGSGIHSSFSSAAALDVISLRLERSAPKAITHLADVVSRSWMLSMMGHADEALRISEELSPANRRSTRIRAFATTSGQGFDIEQRGSHRARVGPPLRQPVRNEKEALAEYLDRCPLEVPTINAVCASPRTRRRREGRQVPSR